MLKSWNTDVGVTSHPLEEDSWTRGWGWGGVRSEEMMIMDNNNKEKDKNNKKKDKNKIGTIQEPFWKVN